MAGSQLKQLKANLHARRTAQNAAPGKQGVGQKAKPARQTKRDPRAQADALRRSTLLPAIQNRHRVGGIIDRRIGENDPTMSPEERMLQRFTRQRAKRSDAFNLEDDDDADLTHGGRSLFDGEAEDFAEGDLMGEDTGADESINPRKRERQYGKDTDVVHDVDQDEPQRKRSKKEIMEDVIAKSKYHKAERQKEKDEDEDVRDELDKELPDLLAMLRGGPRTAPDLANSRQAETVASVGMAIHPDRAAQMSESVEEKSARAAKDYDKSLRRLAMDKKAQPVDRTKTDEEKVEEEAARLKEQEASRLRRMMGQEEESDSDPERSDGGEEDDGPVADEQVNEAAQFGLEEVSDRKDPRQQYEDEDDFIIDEDLVASGSEVDESDFSEADSALVDAEQAKAEEEEDEEFLKDIMPERTGANTEDVGASAVPKLAYTYPCPETHAQLLDVVKSISFDDLPTVIQRIRALYHPQLNAQNKAKLAKFTGSLIDHVSYLGSQKAPLPVIETLIRHVHSLAKTHPEAAGEKFRLHLAQMQERGSLGAGDLLILTAIGNIFPTSDHFHQVVTPAITIIARWLGMTSPQNDSDYRTGAYLVALCLEYQALSKRFIPEAIAFVTAAISGTRRPDLLALHIRNLTGLVELYADKSAFFEVFYPAAWKALKATGDIRAKRHLRIALRQSIMRRRPLELHHHRPLAIKTSVPKFEEGFNPNKHYDPDRERAESNRLRKEYKRERKGAVRELRKDAAFMHRESFKEKKERDAEYERKQRRLIAEIQGEEGREGNAYEREKRKRKASHR